MTYHGTAGETPVFTAEVLTGGTPQDIYWREPDGRLFTAGREGEPYTLRVTNRSYGRIEVLVSVDGSDIHSDAAASITTCTGLVIPPRGTYEFRGFRTDDDHTREFIFGGLEGSVTERSGRGTENAGVIGFAAYREYTYRPARGYNDPVEGYRGRASGQSFSAGAAGGPATHGLTVNTAGTRSLATHIGDSREDKVGRTSFERAGTAVVLAIGYDTLDRLRDLGIYTPRDPEPFPASAGYRTGYERY